MDHPGEQAARPLRIVIPGGSGQVGQLLARYFQERGHHVAILTRGPYTAPWHTVHWDAKSLGPWVETLDGADVCIHLSGRSVNCRSTARNRRELYDSRIGPTRLLHQAFAVAVNPPRLWLNASTATIYRHALDRGMDEATGELGGNEPISRRRRAPAKWNWTVQLVRDWEAAFFSMPTPRTRKVALRGVGMEKNAASQSLTSWTVQFHFAGARRRREIGWLAEVPPGSFVHAAQSMPVDGRG